MAAELSIAIKIGATVGGAIAALRSILGGTRDLRGSTKLLQNEYHRLGRDIQLASQMGGSALARLQRQHASLGQTIADMRRNQVRQNAIQTQLSNGKAYREQLRSEAMNAFVGVGAVLVPIKAAMDFETSMADVRKVVDFDTPQQFKEMEQQLLSMTHQIPMSANELAKIAASGGQLGIARQDIAGFTETIAKMSVAFDMSAEQAGDSMAKLANVYQIPIAQIGQLGDAINHLSNSSPAKASDIVNTLGRVGGVAKQFGLTELQTASLSNAFISLGKTPEIAGTAINGMLTRLMTADKQGSKFQNTLKAMGISAQELKRNIAQNGEQALLDFMKRINQLPKEGQMGVLVDLFGLEYADDVAVLAGSLDTYRQSIDALKQTDASGSLKFMGSMDKEFAVRSATTANNWQLLKNHIAHLGISIGSVILPAVNDLLNSLKPLIEQVIQFAQAHPNLIKNIFLTVVALASFKAGSLIMRFGLSLLGSSLWGVLDKVSAFSSSLLRLRGVLNLLNLGRSTAALRMLGLSARQARVVLTVLSASLKGLGSAFHWLLGIGTRILAFLPILGQAFLTLGRFLLMTPIGLALGLMATAAYLLYTRWGAVVGGAKLLWQDLCNVVMGVANAISAFFSNAWATMQMLFHTALNAILARIMSFSPVTAFQAAFAAVHGFFSGLAATFMSYGGMLIDGLANGIRAKIGSVLASVQSMAASVKSAFTGAMQIHSPSRVFRAYGGFMTEGLAIGVNKGANKAVGSITQLSGSLKSRFAENMGNLHANLSARLSHSADNLNQARQAQSTPNQGITIHFNPTINAAGGNPQQIETALQMGLREFEDLFKRMMSERERRAY